MINVILGCSGTSMTKDEATIFKKYRPAGLILFRRNCENPTQMRALINTYYNSIGHRRAIVMIDEEGGAVQRMNPPVWHSHPPMKAFGDLYAKNPTKAVELLSANCRAIAMKLRDVGINTVAAPVLDIAVPFGHSIISNRSFSANADTVVALGKIACDTFLKCGILPIVKHIPGHGRATCDSHESLPTVHTSRKEMEETDFKPFCALADQPFAMIAHIVYAHIDPDKPASVSKIVHDFIRHNIGFNQLTMSDCIHMNALRGTIAERAANVIAAGYDFALNSHGSPQEMDAVAQVCSTLTTRQGTLLNTWLDRIRLPEEAIPNDAGQYLAQYVEAELAT